MFGNHSRSVSSTFNSSRSVHFDRWRSIAPAFVVLAMSATVAGCSSPLTPLVFDERNTDRLLALDCKNVSKDQVVKDFRTDVYMTTGTAALGEAWRSEFPSSEIATGSLTVLGRMPPDDTFCMVYDATFDEVSSAVDRVIESIGMPMVTRDVSSGEYESEFLFRVPPENLPLRDPNLKWREKYLIYVSNNLVYGTDVRVYRDIAIAREPANSEDERRYYRSKSVGNNEAWILLRVSQEIG